MKLAIFGGTFDPIHVGHLIAAEQVAEALGLEKVLFVPAGKPYHKAGRSISDAEQRCAMARLATGDNPRFEVSRLEIERTGPSYSIETIRWFNERHGEGQVGFIIGIDALAEVGTWYQHEAVMREANFVVLHRPSHDVAALRSQVPDDWFSELRFVPVTPVDISSSQIRQRVGEGRSIRYLTPDAVGEYIREQGLYRP